MKTILNSVSLDFDVIIHHFDRPIMLSPEKDDYDWYDKSSGLAKTKTKVESIIIMWEDKDKRQRKFVLKKQLLDKIIEGVKKIHGKPGEPDCPY